MDIFRRQRQYNITSILRSGAFGFVGKQIGDSMGRADTKAAAALNPVTATPTAAQTVGDRPNQTDQANNLGRAALISTSPSGVLGSDPTGRRKLLGND